MSVHPGHLYVLEIKAHFREKGLDSAERVRRAVEEAVREALIEHDLEDAVSRVRADPSNFRDGVKERL